jgi:hypothetical protein
MLFCCSRCKIIFDAIKEKNTHALAAENEHKTHNLMGTRPENNSERNAVMVREVGS